MEQSTGGSPQASKFTLQGIQLLAMLMKTDVKQCFQYPHLSAWQYCSTFFELIQGQQCSSILLTTVNNMVSKTF